LTGAMQRLAHALADRYRIDDVIGSGGMATVYLAHDVRHDRRVAIKVLHPELAAAIGSERFLREIRVTANLQHPRILPLFDSGEVDSLLFYVMPFIEGDSLRARLSRDSQLPIEDSIAITQAVASALDFAHKHGVVHRDIKPENILLGEGEAMVADFGIALAVSTADAGRITDTGLAVGTPAYMSPEQASAEREVDGRSDIYSLACVLYEMLAGEPPYVGPNVQAVITKRLTDPAPSVRRLRSTVPEGLDRALMKALAKVPADRFNSAVDFAESLTRPAAVKSGSRSIAVLPFVNMSADPENEFFSDGITEDIIAQLSKIGTLKVISRTSVMRFKQREQSLKEIGQTLGVGTILEGSVRRAGNRVRIVAQLIDAQVDEHLWAETYDRELTDIFAIQSDVALQIAGALETELTADQKSRIEKEPTDDLEAYQLYLKGRHCGVRFTAEGIRQGIEYLKQAIEKDPKFALPYVELSLYYVGMGMGHGSGDMRPGEAYAKAKAAAAKALELDRGLGDAHRALALPMFVHDFDWAGAETTMKRALELSPNSSQAHDVYGVLLAAQGRYDEAIAAQKRAQELDPLAPMHSSDLASTLLRSGRYDEAAAEARRIVELEPHYPLGHSTLGWARMMGGQYAEGLAELERAAELAPGGTFCMAQLGQAYAMAGKSERARAMLKQLMEVSHERYVPPYHMAYVYTGLAEQEKALDALEQAYEERAGGIYGIKGSFLFTSLRSHPRFRALLAKMNL